MPETAHTTVSTVVPKDHRAAVLQSAATVTVQPIAGEQHYLTWAEIDEVEAWHQDLGRQLALERERREDAQRALAEMDESLRKVGAR